MWRLHIARSRTFELPQQLTVPFDLADELYPLVEVELAVGIECRDGFTSVEGGRKVDTLDDMLVAGGAVPGFKPPVAKRPFGRRSGEVVPYALDSSARVDPFTLVNRHPLVP